MSKQLEFYFDVMSPAAYLAWTQLPALLDETGAEIVYRPIFLPGIFEGAKSSSPIESPAKGRWVLHDFKRHANKFEVPFKMNEFFPMSSVYAMRGIQNYLGTDKMIPLADGFFKAIWVENQNITDQEVVTNIVVSAGIDPQEYVTKLNDPANKQALMDANTEAVERGVFGAPTFFVGKIMQWGQDRLDFVREDLLA